VRRGLDGRVKRRGGGGEALAQTLQSSDTDINILALEVMCYSRQRPIDVERGLKKEKRLRHELQPLDGHRFLSPQPHIEYDGVVETSSGSGSSTSW
jgi:hypothetical protein